MVTFAEFIENAASTREFVNVLFEERVFERIGSDKDRVHVRGMDAAGLITRGLRAG
jgi:hypothetical protein